MSAELRAGPGGHLDERVRLCAGVEPALGL